MGEFEAIRPYNDAEVPRVLARLIDDDHFIAILAGYRFPRLSKGLGWVVRPLLRTRLRQELGGIQSVAALQDKLEPYVDRAIEKASDGVTYSGPICSWPTTATS